MDLIYAACSHKHGLVFTFCGSHLFTIVRQMEADKLQHNHQAKISRAVLNQLEPHQFAIEVFRADRHPELERFLQALEFSKAHRAPSSGPVKLENAA